MPDYPLFKLVSLFYEVVPPVLQAGGKVRQNPRILLSDGSNLVTALLRATLHEPLFHEVVPQGRRQGAPELPLRILHFDNSSLLERHPLHDPVP